MNTLVCLRTTDALHVVPGSVERACRDCGHAVYVSPESLRIVESGARLVCSRCVRTEQATAVAISRAQARELAAWLRRN